MRAKFIATVVVFILALTVCILSMTLVFSVLDRMDDMAAIVLERTDVGDKLGAREALAQMAEQFQKQVILLEILTPHEDLHAITIQYVEAATNLEANDMTDFMRSVALLKESLKHLREHESLRLSNLL